jgi:HEAT repeat protein
VIAMKAALLAALVLAALPLVAAAQPAAPAARDGFASRLVASRAWPRDRLVRLAQDADPLNRQCALLHLAEADPPTSAEIDALIRGLADPVEPVRHQAAAGLLRLREGATAPLLRALADATVVGDFSYDSKAMNGGRSLSLQVRDLAYAMLAHGAALDTATLLEAYQNRPTEPKPLAPPRQRRQNDLDDDRTDGADRPRPGFTDRLLGVLTRGPIAMTPGLTAAVSSTDARLAAIAAERIGEFGPAAAEAVPALAAVTETRADDDVRIAASKALGRMGPQGVAALGRLLESPRAHARRAAISVLPIEDGAGASIVSALGDQDASVRAEALSRIEEPIRERSRPFSHCPRLDPRYDDDNGRDSAEYKAEAKFLTSLPAATGDRLRALLADADAEVRARAAAALTIYTCAAAPALGSDAAGRIASLLTDPAESVRTAANRALWMLAGHGIRPPASALPSLYEGERRASKDSRVSILQVMAGIVVADAERPHLVQTIMARCMGENLFRCDDVMEVLAATNPAAADLAIPYVIDRLRSPTDRDDPPWDMLTKLGSARPAFRQGLETLFARRRDWVRTAAALQLAERGWASPSVFDELVRKASAFKGYTGHEGESAEALAKAGDEGLDRLFALLESSATPLETKQSIAWHALNDVVAENRRVADWALAAAGGAVEPAVQERALWLLKLLVNRGEDVIRVLRTAAASPHVAVRREAADAWVETKSQVDAAAVRLLTDPDADVRENAMPLLARFEAGDRGAAGRRALQDPVPDVREAALTVLVALGPDGAELVAEFIDQHELTPQLLQALSSPLRQFLENNAAPEPLDPRIIAALVRKAKTATGDLRLMIDTILSRAGVVTALDLAPLRARLDSEDARERASAASALLGLNDDPWREDGRLLAVLMDTRVGQSIIERLGTALDELYPPGFVFTSGRIDQLPVFPWPPPPGYSAIALPRDLLTLGASPTLGDVYSTLIRALSTASVGFTQGLFRTKGGFAIVARMERVDAAGQPLPGRARWLKDGTPTLSLIEFLSDLFFERPGYFRVVAFVVTDETITGSNPKARLPEPNEGAPMMPTEMTTIPLGDRGIVSLVYSFERRPRAVIQPWRDGTPSPREHLERAGIWTGFAAR